MASIVFLNSNFWWKLMPMMRYNDVFKVRSISASVSNVIQYHVFNFETIPTKLIKHRMKQVMRRYIYHAIGPFGVSSLGIKVNKMSLELLQSMSGGNWTSLHSFINSKWTFEEYDDCIRYNFDFVLGIGNFWFVKSLIQHVCLKLNILFC